MPAALSLFFPYACGLGFLALALLQPDVLRSATDGRRAIHLLAIAILFGALLHYSLVIILGRLDASFAAGAAFSLAGLVYTGAAHHRFVTALRLVGHARLAFTGILILVFAIPILFTPITEWDPRSIWFFHAKMIYYAGGLTNETGFAESAVQFSHVGYPKLIPVLAAQAAYLSGVWNEYLPKFSLLVLLIPGVLITVAHIARGALISNILLIVLLFLGHSTMLWTGWMDQYLAVYASLACLSLVRWLQEGDAIDGLTAIACLAVSASLKNEGLLITVLIMTVASGYLALSPGKSQLELFRRWRVWLLIGLGFSGAALWYAKKAVWHLPQSAEVAIPHLGRFLERLGSNAVGLIGEHLLIESRVASAVACLMLAFGYIRVSRLQADRTVWLPALFSMLYCAGLFAVYLNTPNDLAWHLNTSAERTTLPVRFCLLLTAVLLLQSWEHQRKQGHIT